MFKQHWDLTLYVMGALVLASLLGDRAWWFVPPVLVACCSSRPASANNACR
jgi:hypothetical protein